MPARLLLAAPEGLICFMEQHMYKCRTFSSRYPIAAFKYYITYGLGSKLEDFLTRCAVEEEHKKLSSATP